MNGKQKKINNDRNSIVIRLKLTAFELSKSFYNHLKSIPFYRFYLCIENGFFFIKLYPRVYNKQEKNFKNETKIKHRPGQELPKISI